MTASPFRKAVLVGSVLLYAGSLPAVGVYTNLAGRTISADPVRLDGAKVVFAVAPKGEREIPLSVFPASERTRIRSALGIREVPSSLRSVAAELAAQVRRAEVRAAAGRMTSEKLAAQRGAFAAAWRHSVGRAALSDEEKSFWVSRCPWSSTVNPSSDCKP